MPGLALDLNLDPELQATCRRLSFRDAYSPSSPKSPPLPTIDESSEEEPTPPPPTSPRTTGAPYPVPGETLMPTVGAPVATWLTLAPPAQLQSQQAHEVAAPTTMLAYQRRRREEERASFVAYQRPAAVDTLALTLGAPVVTSLAPASSFAEYQRQRQQAVAVEAGLQQALAAQQQSQQLMLYTVDGRAASYETKWDELHPVSQGLLLQIEDRIREHRDESGQLDQCRLFDDLSLCNMSFELNASQITQVEQQLLASIVYLLCSEVMPAQCSVHLSPIVGGHHVRQSVTCISDGEAARKHRPTSRQLTNYLGLVNPLLKKKTLGLVNAILALL